MGYHVAIVRTGQNRAGISQDEIVAVVERLGYALMRDEVGSIKHAFREVDGEEIVLFYDDKQLWAKDPSEVALQGLLEVARAIGAGARVRGDDGETYKTVNQTYHHPDDAKHTMETSFDWKYWVSWILQFSAVPVFYMRSEDWRYDISMVVKTPPTCNSTRTRCCVPVNRTLEA